jgi:adenylate cyclase
MLITRSRSFAVGLGWEIRETSPSAPRWRVGAVTLGRTTRHGKAASGTPGSLAVSDARSDPLKLDLRQAILRRGNTDDIDPEAEGLLDGLTDEREREARGRLIRELARDGASVEELRDAIERDRLSLLPLGRALAGQDRACYTISEVAKRSGVEESYLRALRRALGLPRADGRDAVGSDSDVEAAEMVQRFREAGLPDDGLLEIARVMGHGMSLLAATVQRVLADALLEEGDTEVDAALRYGQAVEQLRGELGPLLEYVLAVHQREQVGSEVVGRTEHASGRLAGGTEVTVCFADLVGFTELGEAIAPAGLGAVAGRLTDLAIDRARPPVRLVKMIGDAALLVSPDTDALLVAALELMDAVDQDPELPPLRIGVTRGQAITRGGEWYGTPLNRASKLTASAGAGRVLATTEVREAAGPGFAWADAGRRRLGGVKQPVEVLEVGLGRSSRREPWPGYDTATVADIRSELASTDGSLATRVKSYERRHKRRKGVLEAADVRRGS